MNTNNYQLLVEYKPNYYQGVVIRYSEPTNYSAFGQKGCGFTQNSLGHIRPILDSINSK